MADLRTQLEESTSRLRASWTELSSTASRRRLPDECYRRWIARATLHSELAGTVPLLEIREKAWLVVRSLVDRDRIEREESRLRNAPQDATTPIRNFSHDGIPVDFPQARYLSLASYMTSTWAIYDRLTNVCGRLAATEMVQQHQKQNPKLCEDFLSKEKERDDAIEQSGRKDAVQGALARNEYGHQLFAFSMQYHLRSAYAWPAKVSYAIRNWLVHEGCSAGNTELFSGNDISDGLRLSDDAVNIIERRCSFREDGDGDPRSCCLKWPASPWRNKSKDPNQAVDLMGVLDAYHSEIDTMFVGLLKWTTDAFVGQVGAFTARDRA